MMIEINRNKFLENIKINMNLINLQEQLREEKINISELDEKSKDQLIEQYRNQIYLKENELNYIKEKILEIRKGE